MQDGKVAIISDSIGAEISETAQQKADGGYSWVVRPELTGAATLPDETTVEYTTGTAAWSIVQEEDITHITDEGNIRQQTEERTVAKKSDFIFVPGHCVILEDMGAVPVINNATHSTVRESGFDLNQFLRDRPGANATQANFAYRAVESGGTKGALYGNQLTDDPDLGTTFERSPLPDLGVSYQYYNSFIDAYLAESGYVAVYSDWTESEFVQWVIDEVLPYAREGEDSDSCTECGRESDDLQSVNGKEVQWCPICRDKHREEQQEVA